MAGAYTAKPVPTPTPPDVPPGWNLDWPFPGAYPPGYNPVLSLGLTAPGAVSYDGVVVASARLYDRETYPTAPVTSECRITWTATIDGESVPLRFEGGGSYYSSRQSSYSETESFWGATPRLEFQLTEEANGKVLMLQATSKVGGGALQVTRGIEVAPIVRIFGHTAFSAGGDAADVIVSLYTAGSWPTATATAISDDTGNWSLEVEFAAVSGGMAIEAVLAGYESPAVESPVVTGPGEYEQAEIIFSSRYSAVIDYGVSRSAILAALSRLYINWDWEPKVGFTWNDEAGTWLHDDGGGDFRSVATGEGAGTVTLSSDSLDNLLACGYDTLTLYSYAEGVVGQQSTVAATIRFYVDGNLQETHSKTLTATVEYRPFEADWGSERLDWIRFNGDSITVLA